MSILSRFRDIMASNVNTLLDKMEDPSKLIDQAMRDLQSQLGEVKAETAGVMAQEQAARRDMEACREEIEKFQQYAEKAVLAGNDGDASLFLQKKQLKTGELVGLTKAYTVACENSTKMRQMFDHLSKQIEELESKRAQIKATVAVAKTQEKINNLNGAVDNAKSSMSKFDAMARKADEMLDKANAMAELNDAAAQNQLDDLMEKYDESETVDVDTELKALKAKLGVSES